MVILFRAPAVVSAPAVAAALLITMCITATGIWDMEQPVTAVSVVAVAADVIPLVAALVVLAL
jgi:3D (Asp-Asp-Asp) domain-containing protein